MYLVRLVCQNAHWMWLGALGAAGTVHDNNSTNLYTTVGTVFLVREWCTSNTPCILFADGHTFGLYHSCCVHLYSIYIYIYIHLFDMLHVSVIAFGLRRAPTCKSLYDNRICFHTIICLGVCHCDWCYSEDYSLHSWLKLAWWVPSYRTFFTSRHGSEAPLLSSGSQPSWWFQPDSRRRWWQGTADAAYRVVSRPTSKDRLLARQSRDTWHQLASCHGSRLGLHGQ